jgi:hypothetical protein
LEVAATASPSIPIAPPLPDSDNVSIDLGFSDFGNTSPAPADFQFEVDEPTAAPEIPPNLSPAAKELAGFFAKEIATNTGIARPDVIEFGAPAISIEPEDFSKAADEWKPKHPNVGESLTDWQSKSTVDETFFRPQETASMGEGIFDLGGSNFEFSDDYILKLGTGLPFAQPTPAAIAPATNVREINRPAAAEPKTTTPAPARPQMLERAEMEALVREEARKVCQDIVDKIAWEVIPELAENIIRRELDRVLAELDKENPPRN